VHTWKPTLQIHDYEPAVEEHVHAWVRGYQYEDCTRVVKHRVDEYFEVRQLKRLLPGLAKVAKGNHDDVPKLLCLRA